MITTIQISEEIRTELKVLAAQRRISYGDLLQDLIAIYEAMMPFKSDNEFKKWFEDNYGSFGFKEIIERKPDNLYVLKDKKKQITTVYLTCIFRASNLKDFDLSNINLIISVFSNQTEIGKTPVISLLKQLDPKSSIKIFEGKYTAVPLPISLYKKVKKTIDGTGFHDVPSYVSYILREILAEKEIQTEKTILTSEDEEKVKQRLRALGYL